MFPGYEWVYGSARMSGVNAPLVVRFPIAGGKRLAAASGSDGGEWDLGEERLLGVPLPRVAMTDGEEGGSGERVK
jgi:hypothetical protein